MRKQYKEIKDAYILRQKEEIKIYEEIENKIRKSQKEKNKKELQKKMYNIILENENKEKYLKIIPSQLCITKETKETETELDSKNELLLLAKYTDRHLLEIISKDINRTHAFFHFFSKPVNTNLKISQEEINLYVLGKQNLMYQDIK